jgi:hypothetical protein
MRQDPRNSLEYSASGHQLIIMTTIHNVVRGNVGADPCGRP